MERLRMVLLGFRTTFILDLRNNISDLALTEAATGNIL